ncbi:MAG: hypothetical protein LBJ08_02280, partial [Bifidobacteriaceae bacterium]|nr:hypothetical protein [Bifidobacteriaceae bacterium]
MPKASPLSWRTAALTAPVVLVLTCTMPAPTLAAPSAAPSMVQTIVVVDKDGVPVPGLGLEFCNRDETESFDSVGC